MRSALSTGNIGVGNIEQIYANTLTWDFLKRSAMSRLCSSTDVHDKEFVYSDTKKRYPRIKDGGYSCGTISIQS